MLPLAKRSETNSKAVDAFQLVVGGMELVKAFSELNDPIDQRERFSKEQENAKAGDSEAQPNDEEFIEALEYGMPPAGGVGIGIDRLVMLLADTQNIKEVIFFPTMKPKDSNEKGASKKKDTKIAVAVIDEKAAKEGWQKYNTVAHLTASLGARFGKSLLYTDKIKTKDDQSINLNIQHAIMIKSADSQEDMLKLVKAAHEKDLEVEEFTREMIETTNDKKVIAATLEKNSKDIERLGVLVFGSKAEVDAITKDFSLIS
jgi:lysyl-tRNA synthetase class 2